MPIFRKEKVITGPQYGVFDAKYLGGHSAYPKQKECKLHVYPTHVEIPEMMLKIPYEQIENVQTMTQEKLTATRLLLLGIFAFAAKKKKEYLVITYRDVAGIVQNPVFDVKKLDEAQPAIYHAKLAATKPTAPTPMTQPPVVKEKEIVREVVMISCAYCGSLMPQTSTFCPNCGARRK